MIKLTDILKEAEPDKSAKKKIWIQRIRKPYFRLKSLLYDIEKTQEVVRKDLYDSGMSQEGAAFSNRMTTLSDEMTKIVNNLKKEF